MQLFWLVIFTFVVNASNLLAMPTQVILLRHAEKPVNGNSLSPKGFKRADALVSYFSNTSLPFQLQTPMAIFAQRSKNQDSTRPVQTVGPLSNFWQIPLYTDYSSGKYKKMVNEIAKNYNAGLVVVCWSHDNLSAIANEFGVKNAPIWPGNEFNWVWVINFQGNKVISFQKYLQDFS